MAADNRPSASGPISKKRNDLLRRGQRAVMTVQPGLRRIDVTLDDTDSSVGGRDDVADALPRPLRDSGPEDPRGDRLLPPPDPHPAAEDRPPGSEHIRRRARNGRDVARSSLAGKHP